MMDLVLLVEKQWIKTTPHEKFDVHVGKLDRLLLKMESSVYFSPLLSACMCTKNVYLYL